MRHVPHKKPPKLRYKPGSFVRDKKGQLYCIRTAYRTTEDPHEWVYDLEYREDLGDPRTQMSELCAEVIGQPVGICVVVWEPLSRRDLAGTLPGMENAYRFGDSKHVTNKKMLQEYSVVSSGQVLPKE